MGPRVVYEVMVSKVSMSKVFKSLQGSKGFKTCREISLVYPQGIKGTIFSLSVLDYEQRYYAYT